jgi:hypothetical protein
LTLSSSTRYPPFSFHIPFPGFPPSFASAMPSHHSGAPRSLRARLSAQRARRARRMKLRLRRVQRPAAYAPTLAKSQTGQTWAARSRVPGYWSASAPAQARMRSACWSCWDPQFADASALSASQRLARRVQTRGVACTQRATPVHAFRGPARFVEPGYTGVVRGARCAVSPRSASVAPWPMGTGPCLPHTLYPCGALYEFLSPTSITDYVVLVSKHILSRESPFLFCFCIHSLPPSKIGLARRALRRSRARTLGRCVSARAPHSPLTQPHTCP